jgi:hypothetical protein
VVTDPSSLVLAAPVPGGALFPGALACPGAERRLPSAP